MLRTIKNTFHLAEAIIANALYGYPARRLKIIAITGTDGKTTTTTLTYHILKNAGYKVAMISTVAAYIGDEEIDTGFHVTTPSSFALARLLRRIASKGYEYVVMEVTSHGIDQNRIWGIHPTIAGLTNITHEHLDYHGTYDQYLKTKTKLFERSNAVFLNVDDQSFDKVSNILEEKHIPFHTYTNTKLHGQLKNAVMRRYHDQTYNQQNASLAIMISKVVGVEDKQIADAIASFSGVPGRMQEIPVQKKFRVIVDFAHTPNALEQALMSVRNTYNKGKKKGSIIVVFGCAGLRDYTKRPLMGEIASRLADYVILTAEDPRTEDVWSIIAQIKSGIVGHHDRIVTIVNRYQAIEYAINTLAKSGDTVIITGKGHEKSMCFGTIEYPWSDQDAVKDIVYGK